MIDIASLSWRLPENEQQKNISQIDITDDDIGILILPFLRQDCWENCAKLISKIEDERLSSFLPQLLEWYKDLSWPGIEIIDKRIRRFPPNMLQAALTNVLCKAKNEGDEEWYENLCNSFFV